jgi:hypothetical protein
VEPVEHSETHRRYRINMMGFFSLDPSYGSQKALRIDVDVDIELDRALDLWRGVEPFADVGREVERTRAYDTPYACTSISIIVH